MGHQDRHVIGSASFDHSEPVDALPGDLVGPCSKHLLAPAKVILPVGGPDEVLDPDAAERMVSPRPHTAQIQLEPVWADEQRGCVVVNRDFQRQELAVEAHRPLELPHYPSEAGTRAIELMSRPVLTVTTEATTRRVGKMLVDHDIARHGDGGGPFEPPHRPLVVFGDGEQDDRILDGVEGVTARGYDDQVTLAAVPGVAAGEQADPAGEDVDGGLARVLVLGQGGSGGQRDECLAQHLLVAAIDGMGVAATRRGSG
jgi:hypothetical protein